MRSKTSRETVSGLAARVGVGGLLAVLPDPTQAFRATLGSARRARRPRAGGRSRSWTGPSPVARRLRGRRGGFTSGRGADTRPPTTRRSRVDGGERRLRLPATRTEVTARGGEVDVLVESSRLERRDPWPGGAGEEAPAPSNGDTHARWRRRCSSGREPPRRGRGRERWPRRSSPRRFEAARGGRGGEAADEGAAAAEKGREKATAPPPKRKGCRGCSSPPREPAPDGRGRAPGRARRARRRAGADGCYALLREMPRRSRRSSARRPTRRGACREF